MLNLSSESQFWRFNVDVQGACLRQLNVLTKFIMKHLQRILSEINIFACLCCRNRENYIRPSPMIILECHSGAKITLGFDLFEDVLAEDWIYSDCSRERQGEITSIRLHFRVRFLSVCKHSSMHRGEWDTLKHRKCSVTVRSHEYYIFMKKPLICNSCFYHFSFLPTVNYHMD